MLLVHDATLAWTSAVLEVSRVNLNTRLVRVHVHLDARTWVKHDGANLVLVTLGVEHPVVVVTATYRNHLGVVLVEVSTDGLRSEEVKHRALHRTNLTRWDEVVVARRVVVSVHIQDRLVDGVVQVTRKIEVSVVRHVEHSSCISRAVISDGDGVVVGQLKLHRCHNRAGELVVAILRSALECERLLSSFHHVIHLILPTRVATMQASHAIVVLVQRHRRSIVSVLTVVDAVRIAANGTTEVSLKIPWKIVLDLVETTGNVNKLAILVRHHDAHDTSTEVRDAHLHAILVGERVELHLLGIRLVSHELLILSVIGYSDTGVIICWIDTRLGQLRSCLLCRVTCTQECYGRSTSHQNRFKISHNRIRKCISL